MVNSYQQLVAGMFHHSAATAVKIIQKSLHDLNEQA